MDQTKPYLMENDPHTKHQFICDILQALHLQTDWFMYNLAHQQPYECIVYRWMLQLYDKNMSSQQAIALIYKARNIFLLQDSSITYKPIDQNTT